MSKYKTENKFILSVFLNYIKHVDHFWVATWIIIFVGFMTLDAFTHITSGTTFFGTTVLRYSGIILTIVYAARKFPKDYLLQIALLFTLLADTILVVDSTSYLGVFVFCLAQYFHIARFAGTEPKFFISWTVAVIAVFYFGVSSHLEPMYFLAAIYGASLLINVRLAKRWFIRARKYITITAVDAKSADLMSTQTAKTHKDDKDVHLTPEEYHRELIASSCAFSGFILFLCCDICVALSYLSHENMLPVWMYGLMNYLDWAFYYPAQVLISNSSAITDQPRRRKPHFFKKKHQKKDFAVK